jgi:hypothetical protein
MRPAGEIDTVPASRQCIASAKAHPNPEAQTVWDTSEAERPSLVRRDNNKYSVGRPVEVWAYADRIELRQDGPPVNTAPALAATRQFTTRGTTCRCWCASLVRSMPASSMASARASRWLTP